MLTRLHATNDFRYFERVKRDDPSVKDNFIIFSMTTINVQIYYLVSMYTLRENLTRHLNKRKWRWYIPWYEIRKFHPRMVTCKIIVLFSTLFLALTLSVHTISVETYLGNFIAINILSFILLVIRLLRSCVNFHYL